MYCKFNHREFDVYTTVSNSMSKVSSYPAGKDNQQDNDTLYLPV